MDGSQNMSVGAPPDPAGGKDERPESPRAAAMRKRREALLASPHARALTAFFASPQGAQAARWLRDRFILSQPEEMYATGKDGEPQRAPQDLFSLGKWHGGKDLASLLLGYGQRLNDATFDERTGDDAA